jgi:hypothetical protein
MATKNNRRKPRKRLRIYKPREIPLDILPGEMICEIMSYLAFGGLINISSTCRLLRDIADKYFDRQKIVKLMKRLKIGTDRYYELITPRTFKRVYENDGDYE